MLWSALTAEHSLIGGKINNRKDFTMEKSCRENRTVVEVLQDIANVMCDKYCKYPDLWDEDVMGAPLQDSEVCKNCPLNILA